VQGSVEAAVDEIGKIHHDEVSVQVIHSGVGGIVASDIMLAAASNAIVVGFNVRPNAEAKALADREGVDIRTYRVIYQLTEDIQRALIGMLSPERVEEVLGEVEVRQTFRASRVGTIAGCMVTQGSIQRGAQVRIVRDGTIVHDGRVGTLKRFQDDVREVTQGFECGLTIDGYNDIKEGDVLEVYTVREVARSA
jgi:translation initiation factor IF-2